LNDRNTGRKERLIRLQAVVDDLEALLAHHDEHSWEEPEAETHVLRRLLEVRQQLAGVKGERYTPDTELLERLREAEPERDENHS
jgi:hypothetical protein